MSKFIRTETFTYLNEEYFEKGGIYYIYNTFGMEYIAVCTGKKPDGIHLVKVYNLPIEQKDGAVIIPDDEIIMNDSNISSFKTCERIELKEDADKYDRTISFFFKFSAKIDEKKSNDE